MRITRSQRIGHHGCEYMTGGTVVVLSRHWKLTGSPAAAALLGRGHAAATFFAKVSPDATRRARASAEAGCEQSLIVADRGVELVEAHVLAVRVRDQE
jgi:glutamate synthase domain-containing protein 3